MLALIVSWPSVASAQANDVAGGEETRAAATGTPAVSSAVPVTTPSGAGGQPPTDTRTTPAATSVPVPFPTDESESGPAAAPRDDATPPFGDQSDSSEPASSAAQSVAPEREAAAQDGPGPEPEALNKPLAPPESPLSTFLSVGFAVENVWNDSSAYDFVSERDRLLRGGFSLGVDALTFASAATLSVDLEAMFGETDDEGPLPSFIQQSELRHTNLGAGVGVRYAIVPWLAPHVHIGGGLTLRELELTGVDFGQLREQGSAGYAKVGAGITFLSPVRRLSATRRYFNAIGFSVVAEGGYQATPAIDLSLPAIASNPDEGRNIAVAATPLGSLPLAGPYLRISALARF